MLRESQLKPVAFILAVLILFGEHVASVRLSDGIAYPSEEFSVGMTITSRTRPIQAITYKMSYDSTKVRFNSVNIDCASCLFVANDLGNAVLFSSAFAFPFIPGADTVYFNFTPVVSRDTAIFISDFIRIDEQPSIDVELSDRGTFYIEARGTGIENPIVDNHVDLYPNPVETSVTLYTNAPIQSEVEIYNMLGQRLDVFLMLNNRETFDLTHLASGQYIVRIKSINKTILFIKI